MDYIVLVVVASACLTTNFVLTAAVVGKHLQCRPIWIITRKAYLAVPGNGIPYNVDD